MTKTLTAGGIQIAYEERGRGSETVVFSHSYLVDHHHFDAQIRALEDRFRIIAFDHRDHGASGHATAPYVLDDLVRDAKAVIEHTGSAPCHFVGLSTGGFVGLRLALRHPELLRSLVAMDTSAAREPWLKRVKYEAMFQVLKIFGFGPLIGTVMGLMFSPSFLRDPARQDAVRHWRDRIRDNDPSALIRFGRAIFDRDDLLDSLGSIALPTLVVVGADDRPQPVPRAQEIADGIEGAELAVIPDAGHLSTVDAPEAVNEILVSFLDRVARPS